MCDVECGMCNYHFTLHIVASPRLTAELFEEVSFELVDSDEFLLHGVAFADGHEAELCRIGFTLAHRVEVNGHAERRAEFVLTAEIGRAHV